MAIVIDIVGEKLDCGTTEGQDYADVLNGIVWDCVKNHGFERGWRNTIAVDLTVCSEMLGLDALDVLEKLIVNGVIDPKDDDEATCNRIRTVLDYKDRFSWDWMLDPDVYRDMARDHAYLFDEIPIVFHVS